MCGRAVVQGRRAFMLAVVVTALLFGLVAMHHLSVTTGAAPAAVGVSAPMSGPEGPAMPAGPGHGDPGHEAGLLHLCLAVLTAVAVLVVSAVLWFQSPRPALARRFGASRLRTAPRAPPPTAPVRLALLCVLRT